MPPLPSRRLSTYWPSSGAVAQRYGIENILWVAMSGVLLGVVVAVFLRETAPRKVGAARPQAVAVR